MGQAVTIISKEEALKLPPNQRPLCHRIPEKVYMGIWDAVAAASNTTDPEVHAAIALTLSLLIAEQFEAHGVILLQPPQIVHEVRCHKCGHYFGGHATGGDDICTCWEDVSKMKKEKP